ncbi:e3 ubiquitin-protein ligase RNF13 [Trichonephila clavipes]|nr:e3 ubiquitin-protein ligase RNF13 [Trichonephila clavipes]
MAPHTITPAVGVISHCKAKVGLRRSPRDLHTRTRLSTLLRLNLDSSLKTTWFHSAAVQFPRTRYHSKWRRRWVGGKDSTRNGRRDPKCATAGAFIRFEKTQGPLVNVLPVSGWQPMKQLAVCMHFLRCGGLLDNWSVEGVLSLVFV